MIPIVTPAEMAAIDAAAPVSLDGLIERAGRAVARAAIDMLGGTYGRRVVVVAGPGNNGADGRVAARVLRQRGVRATVVAPDAQTVPAGADLVIDAAFGTGLRRPYAFPSIAGDVPVLAVDLPSGVDGLTGSALGRPHPADRTLCFAALKPGLVFEPGRSLAGAITVADLGLDVSGATIDLVEGADVAEWLPVRSATVHKWHHAVRIVGGSDTMTGAPRLAARAALRSGAGYVQLAIPGRAGTDEPVEAVGLPLPRSSWGDAATEDVGRVGALLVGPGLGQGHDDEVRAVAAVDIPLVVDGDALQPSVMAVLAGRTQPTVVTPHGGEFTRLIEAPERDPVAATRALADMTGAVVLHKGPTTVVAAPEGPVLVVANGDPSLATAGTGDVLAGLVVALLAQGVDPLRAAAAAAWLHAEAGRGQIGLVASDLPDRIAGLLNATHLT
ncbi:MAG: NAD(P)H-hydrate dehydratase [Actinomycetota bacterium]